MKPFRLAAALPTDLRAAHDYYAQYSPRAAERFVDVYVATRDRIIAQPLAYRVRPHGWRQALLPKFPRYAIFFKEKEAFWLFGGILCTVRDPDYLQARLVIRESTEEVE